MNWIRITDLNKFIESEDIPYIKSPDYILIQNIFCLDNNYPLISISIHPDLNYSTSKIRGIASKIDGINITVLYKKNVYKNWDIYNGLAAVPLSLWAHFQAMLELAKDKAEKINESISDDTDSTKT